MSEDNLRMTDLMQYRSYDRQKCFVGFSKSAKWNEDLLMACEEVLSRPEFNLELDYAGKSFAPDVSLQEKALRLIANARYGIYDLSCWLDERGEWQLPRNVYIELGMAIALNRPTLMLRHESNHHLKLPDCLESMSGLILEFSGATTLKRTLQTRLPQWLEAPPDVGWWNRYCVPANRICEFRESHPRATQWGRKTIQCHVSDGPDPDQVDFRALVDDVLGRFSHVGVTYLDTLQPMQGYDFLLCTHCKTVRSSSFAIYRITPSTPAETFIAIGISLALEHLFEYKIPKLLFIEQPHELPSLLAGYEVVVARSDSERKKQLLKFMPAVMQKVRESTWKPRPLPFVEISIAPVEMFEKAEQESAESTDVDEGQSAQAQVLEYERLLQRIKAWSQVLGTARGLTEIFRGLREFTSASVPCNGFFISLYDPVRDVRTVVYGWTDGNELDVSQLPPMPVTTHGPNSRAIRTGEIIITNHPSVIVGPNYGLRPESSMAVPMAVMGRIIGTIEVQSYESNAYHPEHVTAMSTAANLAAVAIENEKRRNQ